MKPLAPGSQRDKSQLTTERRLYGTLSSCTQLQRPAPRLGFTAASKPMQALRAIESMFCRLEPGSESHWRHGSGEAGPGLKSRR